MNLKSQNKLIRILFESDENPVVTTEEDRFHLEDCIEYATKPGIIVATIKGDSESGIQQLPIGAVDSFRFMKVVDENAIINQNKNNGKSYDTILKEYEGQKNQIIDQWKKINGHKLQEVKGKYGQKFLGIDIVENQKQIQHKEDEDTDTKKQDSENTEKVNEQGDNETNADGLEGKVQESIKDWFTSSGRFWNDGNIKSDKKLWKDVMNGVKSNGKKLVKKLSDITINKLQNDESTNSRFFIEYNGSKFVLLNMIITKIQGLRLLGFSFLPSDEQKIDDITSADMNKLDDLLQGNKFDVKRLKDIDGIFVVATVQQVASTNDKNQTGENTNDVTMIQDIKEEGDDIIFIPEKSDIGTKKKSLGKIERFKA